MKPIRLWIRCVCLSIFFFAMTGCGGSNEPTTKQDCQPGQTETCYSGPAEHAGKGECKKGTRTCSAEGKWGACKDSVLSSKEVCDGKDNDCNGQVDDNLKAPACAKSKGPCAGTVQTCGGAKGWQACEDAVYQKQYKAYQAKETLAHCNGKDDDCDGTVDEDCDCTNGQTQTCYGGPSGTKGKGPCKEGTQRCKDGKWEPCQGEVKPQKEICDGKDNNCDGKVDDGCDCLSGATKACGQHDTGLCKKGTQTCKGGKWQACTGEVKPQKEVCGDGKDNDCDGKADEDCQCKPNTKQKCGTDVGSCQAGQQTCSQAGKWGDCQGKVDAQKEVCDGKDNDCDGQTDEALTTTCKTACGTGKVVCQGGKLLPCDAPKPQKETCDGKDNNCDGKTDEGCQCRNGVTRKCGSSTGICQQGTQTCKTGKWYACVGEVKPGKEVCDGKDNDCNGKVDDGSNLCPSGQTCQGVKKCVGSSSNKPLRTGTFASPGRYTVKGTAEIYKDSQGEKVVLSTNFSTSSGPDLKVYLSKDPKGNSTSGNFLDLGKIQKFSGTQTYRLPKGATSTPYKSVVIWCKTFSVNFGYATLKP